MAKDSIDNWGPQQNAATVWLVCSIVFGIALTVTLATIDRKNYDSKGVYLDNTQYKQNRKASTLLGAPSSNTISTIDQAQEGLK